MRTSLILIVGQRNMRKKIHLLPRVMNLVGLKQVNHADVIAVVSSNQSNHITRMRNERE